MTYRRWMLAAVATLAAASAQLCAADKAIAPSYLLAGDEQSLWVVREDRQAATFDIVTRPRGGKWTHIVQQGAGRAALAAAAGGNLHVIFQAGLQDRQWDYRIYGPTRGEGSPGLTANLPALAICESSLIAQGDVPPVPTVDILVWQGEPFTPPPAEQGGAATSAAASSSTSTISGVATSAPAATAFAWAEQAPPAARDGQAASSQAAASAPHRVSVGLMRNVGGEWVLEASLDDVPLSSRMRLIPAAVAGNSYILAAEASLNALLVWKDRRWSVVPLSEQIAHGHVLGMVGLSNRLAILLEQPAATAKQRGLALAVATDPAAGFTIQPVTRDGAPATWDEGQLPQAARLGDQVMLLWSQEGENGGLMLASCSSDGRVISTEKITALAQGPLDEQGGAIMQYFMWGVFILIFVGMFVIRPSSPPKPFVLPAVVAPGNLLKRLVAGLIDFIPFNMLSFAIFQPPTDVDELLNMARQNIVPASVAYVAIGTLSLYVLYCVSMEMRFGATLGKMLFRLKVVADGAVPARPREIVLRNLAKIVELMPLGPPVPILLLLPLINRNRQRLGDMLARTTVIDARTLAAVPPTPEPPSDDLPPEA